MGEWQVHPARNRIRNGSVEVRLKPLSMRLLELHEIRMRA